MDNLDNSSTTRFIIKERPCFDQNPEFKIKSELFLMPSVGRKGEGGLRTKDMFKGSNVYQPLISVITVVYNGEKHLEQTIRSVLEQTYENVEYIVIDGGSEDRTLEIIKKYEDRIDYWVSESDKGIYDAMNKGISLCSGDYVGFLNADDWYDLDALDRVAKGALQQKVTYIFGDATLYHDNKIDGLLKSDLSIYKRATPMCHQALFVSRKYLLQHPFVTKFKRYADYDLMITLIEQTLAYLQIQKPLVNYRLQGFSSAGHINEERFLIHVRHFGLLHALRCYASTNFYIMRMKFKKLLDASTHE